MFRVIGVLVILASQLALAAESGSLCEADEDLIFRCEIQEKRVSLCASKDVTQNSGYIQYRFGTPGEIELEYPKKEVSPAGVFFLSSASYSGGGANMIRFQKDDHEYLVFDSMVRTHFAPGEPSYPDFKAGLIIRNLGEIESAYLCDDNDASIRGTAFKILEREGFDYTVIP